MTSRTSTQTDPLSDRLAFFRTVLERAKAGETLAEHDAAQMMDAIMAGIVPDELLSAYLAALADRGETVDELTGSIRSLRAHMLPFDPGGDSIDVCGTGGDGLGTFNISTAVALVVAAAGVPVTKTGNRSASSRCGSADLLEALGIPIDLRPDVAVRALRETNFVFLFAPQYHPAARHAAPVRRALRRPTIFNWIGPLCNPASPSHQVIGVPREALARNVAETLRRLQARNARVVCGAHGMDELAPCDGNRLFEIRPDEIRETVLHATEAGIPSHEIAALAGGDSTTNAAIVQRVLQGEQGPCHDVICLNAALALLVFGKAASIQEGVALAGEAIGKGKALAVVQKLRAFANG